MRLKRFACSVVAESTDTTKESRKRVNSYCSVACILLFISTIPSVWFISYINTIRWLYAPYISQAIHTKTISRIQMKHFDVDLFPIFVSQAVACCCCSVSVSHHTHRIEHTIFDICMDMCVWMCLFASLRSFMNVFDGSVPPSSGCLLTCCCWYLS